MERRAPRTLDRNEQILYCRMCNDVLNEMQLLKYKKGGKCRLNKKKNVYKAVKRFFFPDKRVIVLTTSFKAL